MDHPSHAVRVSPHTRSSQVLIYVAICCALVGLVGGAGLYLHRFDPSVLSPRTAGFLNSEAPSVEELAREFQAHQEQSRARMLAARQRLRNQQARQPFAVALSNSGQNVSYAFAHGVVEGKSRNVSDGSLPTSIAADADFQSSNQRVLSVQVSDAVAELPVSQQGHVDSSAAGMLGVSLAQPSVLMVAAVAGSYVSRLESSVTQPVSATETADLALKERVQAAASQQQMKNRSNAADGEVQRLAASSVGSRQTMQARQAKSTSPQVQQPESEQSVGVTQTASATTRQSAKPQSRPVNTNRPLVTQTASSNSSVSNQASTATAGSEKGIVKRVAPSVYVFGFVEFRTKLRNMPKWERVMHAERKNPTFGPNASKNLSPSVYARWMNVKSKVANAPLMDKMRAINSFFNQWPYKNDRDLWRIEDYWATPQEFLRRSGDCEDYAIAKYYALRSLGVPASQMYIVAVRESIRGIGHAVLVVFTNENAYVLDNLTNLILVHSRLKNYEPKFAVNEEFRWGFVKPLNR